MSGRPTALVIDDCPDDRFLCRSLLEQGGSGGWAVVEAASLAEGLDAYREHRPECVVLDYRLMSMGLMMDWGSTLFAMLYAC